MASATILDAPASALRSINLPPQSSSKSHNDLAHEWAQRIRNNLEQVSKYPASEDGSLHPSIALDETVMEAPRRKAADAEKAALAEQIAQLLYPFPGNPLGSIIRYEKDIVTLRKHILHQRKRYIEVTTEKNMLQTWDGRIRSQGPWDPEKDPLSLAGAPSLPMPVKIAKPETLEPFFDHLRDGGTEVQSSTQHGRDDAIESAEPYYGIKTLEFEKGVVYSDRRMDLCKMVLGPTNIGDLIESLKTNTFITHFLLGNNIIGPHGAKCIADFVEELPDRIDTWYLAGNCIDAPSFELLVDKWTKSPSVTNIWLKRNPLGARSAAHVFRLITETPNLRTLDLDQTELGDEGVTEIFRKLADHKSEKPLPLRHIYLNAVGIGSQGAKTIAKYLSSPPCTLDSLYMMNNPLGSAGAIALASGLQKNTSLRRLTLASTGMDDDGAIAICEALEDHPKVMVLDLGQHYSTEDLGMRFNWITDRSAYAIHNLIQSLPALQLLNLGNSALSNAGLNEVLRAITASPSIVYHQAKTIHPQLRTAVAIHDGQQHAKLLKEAAKTMEANIRKKYGKDLTYERFLEEEKRWVVNDKEDVRKIDSVYRNRDAGMARRGLKKLDKWWKEDDNTLDEVMAAGPFCTHRRRIQATAPVL